MRRAKAASANPIAPAAKGRTAASASPTGRARRGSRTASAGRRKAKSVRSVRANPMVRVLRAAASAGHMVRAPKARKAKARRGLGRRSPMRRAKAASASPIAPAAKGRAANSANLTGRVRRGSRIASAGRRKAKSVRSGRGSPMVRAPRAAASANRTARAPKAPAISASPMGLVRHAIAMPANRSGRGNPMAPATGPRGKRTSRPPSRRRRARPTAIRWNDRVSRRRGG